MTSLPRPPRPPHSSGADGDALRAAMEQVRGVRRARPAPDAASASQSLQEQPVEGRHLWDLRGRLADDLARVPTPNATVWPGPLAGLVAGLWAAFMSWCVFAGVLLIGWVFAPQGSGSFADVMRCAGSAWIVAGGGAVHWQGAKLSLMPLAATLVIVLFQRRAGTWLVSAVDVIAPRRALAPLFFAIVSSASAQALVAATVMNDSVVIPLWPSVRGAAGVAALGLGWGVSRSIVITIPETIRPTVLVVQRFVVGSAIVATVLVVVSAVVHRTAFVQVLNAIAGDSTSTVQAALLCVLYLPTLIGWVIAVLLGPGFSLGAGTTVSLLGINIGALPPIPLLALVPEHLWPGSWSFFLLPLLLALWATRGAQQRPVAAGVALSVLAVAGVSAVLAFLCSGGIGPGRLIWVGAAPWTIGVASGGWILAAFTLRALASMLLQHRGAVRAAVEGADKLPT